MFVLFFVGTAIAGLSQEIRREDFISTSPNEKSIQVPQDVEVVPSGLRCGVDSLFLALGYLEGELGKKTYSEVAKFFPNVEREGTNIETIEIYLKNEGFYCRCVLLDENVLATMEINSVAFFVQRNESISHVVLLRRKKKNLFQLIDATNGIKMMSLKEAIKQGSSALFVAKKVIDLPSEKTFVEKHGVTFGTFFCSAFLLVFFLKTKKKSNKGTQIKNRGEARS